jgi:hypothetical protein
VLDIHICGIFGLRQQTKAEHVCTIGTPRTPLTVAIQRSPRRLCNIESQFQTQLYAEIIRNRIEVANIRRRLQNAQQEDKEDPHFQQAYHSAVSIRNFNKECQEGPLFIILNAHS